MNDVASEVLRLSSVKPLGTITMCFPHVDEDTRAMMKSLMGEADDFADFTDRLCTRVCIEPTTPLLQYFAVYFSFHLSDYRLVDKLEKAEKVPILAEPLLLVTRYRREGGTSWGTMLQSISRALEEAPNDWISYHLYLKWRLYAELNFPESDIDVKPIDEITEGVSKKKEFEFFKSFLLRLQAIRHHYDLESEKEREALEEALYIAEKWDEQIVVAELLSNIAGGVRMTDQEQGLEILERSRALSESLGHRFNIGYIQHEMAHSAGQQGKMDAAIEHLLEYEKVRESLGLPMTFLNYYFAIYYNFSGNGHAALDRIEASTRSYESFRKPSPVPVSQRAWALTNLGRYDEARDEIEAAKELALKSGVVWYRDIWNPMIEGILDKAERQFETAIDLLKGVLECTTRNPMPAFQNICYVNLVEIEIELLDTESLDRPVDSSGPWMQLFDEQLKSNDFSGFAAYSLILKAKLYQKLGEYEKGRKMLRESLKAAESSEMKYLNNIAASMFPEMEPYTE